MLGIGDDDPRQQPALPRIGPGGTPPFVEAAQLPLGTAADLSPRRPDLMPAIPAGLPVQTLGGLQQIVPPAPAAAQPGILPEVAAPAPSAPVAGLPAIAPHAPAGLMQDDPRRRVDAIVNKNYDIGGADRDKNWTIGDKIASAIAGWAQGGLAGGVRAATDRNYFEKEGDKNELGRLLPKIEAQQKIAERDARTENIHRDNAHQTEVLEARKTSDQQKAADRKRKEFRTRNPYFDPATATPAQKRELAEFGETPESVGGYDFSKSTTKKIGGTTFEKKMGKWVDSGLPKTPGEQVATVRLKDPTTGEVLELETTSAKAAQMLNSRVTADMVADAALDRQSSQQRFNSVENEKDRAVRREQFLTSAKTAVMNGTIQKAKLLADAKRDVQAGDLPQADYDELVRMLQ